MNKSKTVKCASVTLALAALLTWTLPAQARFDYTDWQPQVGPTHATENNLEVQLNKDYTRGLIDENELAMQRRDLDGICVQEDQFRMEHEGLRQKDEKCIMSKLNQFQGDVNNAVADKIQPAVVFYNP